MTPEVAAGLAKCCTDPPPSADGKLYDAYVSYSDSPEDRKFVNFILKPQLERHRGYKLFLDDRDLLPRAGTAALDSKAPPPHWAPARGRSRLGPAPPRSQAPPPRPWPRARWAPPSLALDPDPRAPAYWLFAEPSADLLVNLSRCRRLIVVLSDAFLGRAWCSHSFRWVSRWAGGEGPNRDLLTVPPPQGGPVPAAGAHAQTHLHHLRGPAAQPRASCAAPAAPAPPPGDSAALEARLRGAEGGAGSRVGGIPWRSARAASFETPGASAVASWCVVCLGPGL